MEIGTSSASFWVGREEGREGRRDAESMRVRPSSENVAIKLSLYGLLPSAIFSGAWFGRDRARGLPSNFTYATS